MDGDLLRIVHSDNLLQSVQSRSPGSEVGRGHHYLLIFELGLVFDFLVDDKVIGVDLSNHGRHRGALLRRLHIEECAVF